VEVQSQNHFTDLRGEPGWAVAKFFPSESRSLRFWHAII
jgi:hypothetical protein